MYEFHSFECGFSRNGTLKNWSLKWLASEAFMAPVISIMNHWPLTNPITHDSLMILILFAWVISSRLKKSKCIRVWAIEKSMSSDMQDKQTSYSLVSLRSDICKTILESTQQNSELVLKNDLIWSSGCAESIVFAAQKTYYNYVLRAPEQHTIRNTTTLTTAILPTSILKFLGDLCRDKSDSDSRILSSNHENNWKIKINVKCMQL